jgi:hypothetical protein
VVVVDVVVVVVVVVVVDVAVVDVVVVVVDVVVVDVVVVDVVVVVPMTWRPTSWATTVALMGTLPRVPTLCAVKVKVGSNTLPDEATPWSAPGALRPMGKRTLGGNPSAVQVTPVQ